MMISQILFRLSFIVLLLCTTTLAQSPVQAPVPSGPTNVTKILEKAGPFTTLIRLLSITQQGDQINSQLNNSNLGLTILAPTDSAFSSLKPGTLNSLTDEQKVQLVQFHCIPTFLSIPLFQTLSNPVRTQAGDNSAFEFPLNVTTSGNQVNISSGLDGATVGATVYSDNQLAVYQVDKVLLPYAIFDPAPVSAPSPSKPKKKKSIANGPSSGDDASVNSSGGVGLILNGLVVSIGAALVASFSLL